MVDIFKNKKVIITGDTGFKGSWLSLWLSKLGAEVVGISLPPVNKNDHYNVIGLKSKIKHFDCDIRDYNKTKKIFDDFTPEFLFHLAAQPLVRLSYKEPRETFETNVMGSVNILEIVRNSSYLKSVIYVTSDKSYKNKEWIWGYRENDELGGRDPYSASKSAAEIIFSSYYDSFFSSEQNIGLASVRAGNVIGGGDWSADRIVPDCIRSLSEKKPIFIRNPNATRPWQHVLEPLGGYLKLAGHLYNDPKKYSGSWNFGPNSDSIKTVNELSELIIKNWGEGSIEYSKDEKAPHEATLLHLNCDKANLKLNWYPKWDFFKCVKETVKWYKDFSDDINAYKITEAQINDYMEDIK